MPNLANIYKYQKIRLISPQQFHMCTAIIWVELKQRLWANIIEILISFRKIITLIALGGDLRTIEIARH